VFQSFPGNYHAAHTTISTCGNGGQWVFQAAWRSSVRQRSLDAATLGGSEQSLELFRRQLAELAAG
jgi:hypothetical protein